MVFRGASSIDMALLTELSRNPIPMKTANNRALQVPPAHRSAAFRLQNVLLERS
jgi:hypothetical protein